MSVAIVLVEREAAGNARSARARPSAGDRQYSDGSFVEHERRAVAQRREVLAGLRVDARGEYGIGVRRQIDLGAGDVQEAERIAGGELARFVGADDVVGNGRHGGGLVRRRTQGAERTDREPSVL